MQITESEFFDAVVLKIKALRKEHHISQLKLAHLIGHNSPNYIAKIEMRKGGANYNLHHIYKIAQALELEPSDLLPSVRSAN